MSFLDEVRTKRQKLADVLSDDDYSGIREIVEELYPDRAHFIYELLQNAEDTHATEAHFELDERAVSFEHNGQPFSEENVWAITNIGKGTKRKQDDQIGRFGVGFKAVFAYSETPHIWSPSHSFKISELVLPTAIPAKPALGNKTRFEFPFNNPKKNVSDAYAEVEAGLNELAETTLLFLSHIEVIQWHVRGRLYGEVRRLKHSENHIEISRRTAGNAAEHSHFLRFTQPVIGLEAQRVAIAFPLDLLPNSQNFNSDKPIASQLKIIPANPARVAVFFPAEKEVSGLRFHLHAPFVPELSRASVKDTKSNTPLFSQLAELAARSLYDVRDQGFLNGDFLAVLPSPQDDVPTRYECIREAIVSEMNEHPLTPTYDKRFAPAKHLLQAKASLKELLSTQDIEFLVDYDDEPPQWAIGASQRNSNADKFLSGLAIRTWDIENLVSQLEAKCSDEWRYAPALSQYVSEPDVAFMNWLANKPSDWHQHLYSLLHRELEPDEVARRLDGLKILRLSDGTYSVGGKCYFPTDGHEHDNVLPRVARGVYQSGKNKSQQDEARKLLEKLNVREVGETELVHAILKRRYTAGESFKPDMKDLKRFITLVEKEPAKASLFAAFFVLKRADDKWAKPSGIYLDAPILDTGLGAYFETIGKDAGRFVISSSYANAGVSLERIRKFAEALGVQTQLQIAKVSTYNNPKRDYLCSVGGTRARNRIDVDYQIPHLEELLKTPTVSLSRLIWNTMCRLPAHSDVFEATYQINESYGSHTDASQLIHTLRKYAWVPQGEDSFARPLEANQALLPRGFPFDIGSQWLSKVEFGHGERQRVEQNRLKEAATSTAAKELGFEDTATLARARRFAALPTNEQERILAEVKSKLQTNLPDRELKNPERRAERIAERAKEAPERRSEPRTRSVSIGLEEVKQDIQPYLQQQYTNSDGEMICQICKGTVPFKLDSGDYYFEKVEFLPELKKRHLENYLALCPNHSAMYQHANGSRDEMLKLFEQLESNELEIRLAQKEATIYFTKTHIADLRAVIEVDRTA